jgi:rubrerythrin
MKIIMTIIAMAATYKCKICGAWHGGSKSPDVCPDCWSKGHR